MADLAPATIREAEAPTVLPALRAGTDWGSTGRLEGALFEGLPFTRDGVWLDVGFQPQLDLFERETARLGAQLAAHGARIRERWPHPAATTDAAAVALLMRFLVTQWGQQQDPETEWGRLALQQATADAFGVPLRLFGATAAGRAQAAELYAEHGAVIRDLVRVMYADTQAWLHARDIEQALLWRGMVAAGPPGLTRRRITLQPLSSWSTRVTIARHFAGPIQGGADQGQLLCATVPRARIMGLCRLAFGLMASSSVVVLAGHDDEGWRLCWPDAQHPLAAVGEATYQQLAEQWREEDPRA